MSLEKSSLDHAIEWILHQASIEAKNEILIDKQRRARRDIKLGHSPKCTLTKCAPECKRSK